MAIDWMMQSSGKDAGSTRAPLVSYSFVRRTKIGHLSFFCCVSLEKNLEDGQWPPPPRNFVCVKKKKKNTFSVLYSSLWPFLRAVQYPI
jgi:hypothetical protein